MFRLSPKNSVQVLQTQAHGFWNDQQGAKKRVGRAAIGGYLGVPCMMDLHDVARQLGLKGLSGCCWLAASLRRGFFLRKELMLMSRCRVQKGVSLDNSKDNNNNNNNK